MQKASSLNGKFALVIGYDSKSEQLMLKVAPRMSPIRVKRINIVFPAACPECGCEVTSNQCFDCGNGGEIAASCAAAEDLAPDSEDNSYGDKSFLDYGYIYIYIYI